MCFVRWPNAECEREEHAREKGWREKEKIVKQEEKRNKRKRGREKLKPGAAWRDSRRNELFRNATEQSNRHGFLRFYVCEEREKEPEEEREKKKDALGLQFLWN